MASHDDTVTSPHESSRSTGSASFDRRRMLTVALGGAAAVALPAPAWAVADPASGSAPPPDPHPVRPDRRRPAVGEACPAPPEGALRGHRPAHRGHRLGAPGGALHRRPARPPALRHHAATLPGRRQVPRPAQLTVRAAPGPELAGRRERTGRAGHPGLRTRGRRRRGCARRLPGRRQRPDRARGLRRGRSPPRCPAPPPRRCRFRWSGWPRRRSTGCARCWPPGRSP